jgi:hypothetical protein
MTYTIPEDANRRATRTAMHARTGVKMLLEILAPPERARALENQIDCQIAPRQLPGVSHPAQRKRASANDDVLVLYAHITAEAAIHGVVSKQIREVLGVGQIVDRNQLERRLLQDQLQNRAPDSTEPIDRDPGSHIDPPPGEPGFATL